MMKALLLNDFYVGRFRLLMITAIVVIGFTAAYVLDRMYLLSGLFGLNILAIYLPSILMFEKAKKTKWSFYVSALPIKKTTMVNEKYLIGIIITVVIMGLNIFALAISTDRWVADEYGDLSFFVPYIIIQMFLLCSFMYIAIMAELVTEKKGTYAGIMVIGIVIIAGVAYAFIYMSENIGAFGSKWIELTKISIVIGGIVLLFTILITYFIAFKYAAHREYGHE